MKYTFSVLNNISITRKKKGNFELSENIQK